MMENMNIQSKSNNKKIFIIFGIAFLFLAILLIGYFIFKNAKTEDGIIFNTEKFEKVSEDQYNLNEKIESISGKINSKEEIQKINLTIKSGNFEILNQELNNNNKTWELTEVSFVSGNNEVCIDVKLVDGKELNKCLIINNYEKDNIGSIDTKDDDNDNLKNYEELIFETEIDNPDTDGDGLSDYDEIYITFTDPKNKDTDNNGINDGDEDFDQDKLINSLEVSSKSSPYLSDTDEDGLSDYDEINTYNTLPNLVDTDRDGLSDYDEIINLNSNATEKTNKINVSKSSDDKIASVEIINLDSSKYSTLTITKSNILNLNENIDGYILDAYDFNIDSEEIEAKISFDISNIQLSENSNPVIYYYNEETQMLEELETVIENGKASTTVKHFSTYILVDKTSHDAIWSEDAGKLVSSSYGNLDVVFVIDISSSMDENDPNDSRKQIMSNFISSLNKDDRVGVVLFKRTASILNKGLSKEDSDKKILITDVFNISNDDGHGLDSGTNGSAGLYTAIGMFGNKVDSKRYIIFLTDGEDTHHSYSYDEIYKMALEKDITILTIGLGSSVDADSLREIAEKTNGKYYYVEESSELYSNYSGILSDTNDYRTDSNNDGISDYFTKLMCEGKIKTSTGINPFEGVSYEEIQKSKDYDGDGLSNGDEVEVTVLDKKVYIKYLSDPKKTDTDEDGLNDKLDNSPFTKFDSRFSVVSGLDFVPATPIEDDFEKKSNEVYNTETGDYGSSKSRANAMVTMFGKMPAALALKHFLDNTGTSYNFNNDWGVLNTYRGKENLAKNTNSLMQVVEESVKNKSTVSFATNTELTGTNYSEHLEDLADIGWWYAIGYTRATMVGQATNNSGNYEMTLYYNIVDFYDWNKDAGVISGFGGLVNDAEMYKLHALGEAKQYRINMTFKMKVTWKKGDRYYLNKTKLWETPSTMSVEKID